MGKIDWKRLARAAVGRPPELMFSVVAGTTANTNIALTGKDSTGSNVSIGLKDGLVAVLQFQDTAGVTACVTADLVAETSVTSAGNIQLTTTNTTNKGLLVIWYRRRD